MRAPARHSFSQLARPPELAISGVRIQKLPLTPRPLLFAAPGATAWLPNSVFGSVSQDTHRQALAGLSWLSFSRPLDLPTVPERSQRPAPAVTSRRLPTPAHVERTCPCGQARTPQADLRPFGRSPTLRHDGPDAKAPGSFRIAPIPRAHQESAARERNAIGSNVGITLNRHPGIQSQGQELRIRPTSLRRARTSRSHGIRLYWHSTQWLVRPFP